MLFGIAKEITPLQVSHEVLSAVRRVTLPSKRFAFHIAVQSIRSARQRFAQQSLVESTAAILLRKRKFSDTSLIVSWCTESLGCIQTVAKGARRTKSPFAGKLDLFFEAEIQIARSRKSSLHTLTEVVLKNPFAGIRRNYLRTQAAAYFVELIEICTERDHHEPELFALLRRAFGYLDTHNANLRAVVHFETELARIAGVHGTKSVGDAVSFPYNPAFALGNLFGKLPLSRTPLLKTLASNDATQDVKEKSRSK